MRRALRPICARCNQNWSSTARGRSRDRTIALHALPPPQAPTISILPMGGSSSRNLLERSIRPCVRQGAWRCPALARCRRCRPRCSTRDLLDSGPRHPGSPATRSRRRELGRRAARRLSRTLPNVVRAGRARVPGAGRDDLSDGRQAAGRCCGLREGADFVAPASPRCALRCALHRAGHARRTRGAHGTPRRGSWRWSAGMSAKRLLRRVCAARSSAGRTTSRKTL